MKVDIVCGKNDTVITSLYKSNSTQESVEDVLKGFADRNNFVIVLDGVNRYCFLDKATFRKTGYSVIVRPDNERKVRQRSKKVRPKSLKTQQKKNYGIKNIRFCDPYTIVWWDDGEITRAKCQNGDTYNKETGYIICLLKHISDKQHPYYDSISYVADKFINK